MLHSAHSPTAIALVLLQLLLGWLDCLGPTHLELLSFLFAHGCIFSRHSLLIDVVGFGQLAGIDHGLKLELLLM